MSGYVNSPLSPPWIERTLTTEWRTYTMEVGCPEKMDHVDEMD